MEVAQRPLSGAVAFPSRNTERPFIPSSLRCGAETARAAEFASRLKTAESVLAPRLVQEGWRAERRGGYRFLERLRVECSAGLDL